MNDEAPNFADLFDRPGPTEVIRPKPLPRGTYICIVRQPREDAYPSTGTQFVEFPLGVLAACDDVDDDQLAESLGDDDIRDRELRRTFPKTEKALYLLTEFHEACGLNIANDGMTIRQRNEAVVNREVRVVVKHTISTKDNRTVFANVDRILPAG